MAARRWVVEVHHVIGDSVNVDHVAVPKGGRWESHLKRGGTLRLVVRDRRDRLVRALQYRRADRVDTRPADG